MNAQEDSAQVQDEREPNLSRRSFVTTTGIAALSLSAVDALAATAADTKPAGEIRAAFGYQHPVKPLPFSASSLKGISEKLIQSHWENNYSGAVKALNVLRGRIAQAMTDPDLPPYIYTGLKREQSLRTGSIVLHELYFGNLGGDGKASAELRTRLAASFGSYDAWESEFRRIGMGLAGGSGWVMLGYNRGLGLLENSWMSDHSTAPANTTPILMMDMYEHAFQMDYGAAAAKYVDAFFANIQWDAVATRLKAAG
jgi:Fe-Mn family superoxide dismutase